MRKRTAQKRIRTAAQLVDLYATAPLVVSQRLSRYARTEPAAMSGNANEMRRMVWEKMSASAESMLAMGFAALRFNLRCATLLAAPSFGGRGFSMAKASALIEDGAIDVMSRGLAPVAKRVSANARRLSR